MLNWKGNNRIIPLFTPVIIHVILQVHGEVNHPNLKKKKKSITQEETYFMETYYLITTSQEKKMQTVQASPYNQYPAPSEITLFVGLKKIAVLCGFLKLLFRVGKEPSTVGW